MNRQTLGYYASGACLVVAATRIIPLGFKPFLLHPQPKTAMWWAIAAIVGFLISKYLLTEEKVA